MMLKLFTALVLIYSVCAKHYLIKTEGTQFFYKDCLTCVYFSDGSPREGPPHPPGDYTWAPPSGPWRDYSWKRPPPPPGRHYPGCPSCNYPWG